MQKRVSVKCSQNFNSSHPHSFHFRCTKGCKKYIYIIKKNYTFSKVFFFRKLTFLENFPLETVFKNFASWTCFFCVDSTGKRKEISIQFQYSKACVSALYNTCPFSKDSIQDNVFNSSRFAFRGQRNEKYFPNENASGPSGLAIYCPKIYPIRDPIHFPSFYFPAKSGNERTTGREGLGQQ